MHSLDSPTRPAIAGGAATDVGLFLAGFASEEETASRLGIGMAQLQDLLRELSLSRCAMMPVGVGDDLETRFLDMKGDPFDAPTFDEAVERVARREGVASPAAFRLPAHAIAATASGAAEAAPQGVIVHVGRCGSTLLCNLLAGGGDWVALREPEIFNSLFLARAATRDRAQIDWIETLVERLMACLARSLQPRKTVLKLSSWTAAAAAPLLTRLPGSRVIVVVRDPWKTVASFLAEPPHWYGACPAGSDIGGKARVDAVQFFASAWQSTIRAARSLPAERTLFLYYDDIVSDPVAAISRARHHLGDRNLIIDAAAVARTMGSYSKDRAAEPFDPRGKHRRTPLEGDLANIVAAITADEWQACLDRQQA